MYVKSDLSVQGHGIVGVSENWFVRRIFVPKKERKEQENGESYVTRRYIIFT
jgi:hypothetical protein